jgi:hypothetical protein
VALTPQAFIAKWLNSPIKERAAAQPHFHDLCEMLGVPKPADLDPSGDDYGFEVGATKTTGGRGFADVFRRGFFAWEYKGTGADLDAAFAQLQRYAVALDNPPLLIVSDVGTTIRIYTNWTNSVSKRYDIAIADLGDPVKLGWLRSALTDPDALKPLRRASNSPKKWPASSPSSPIPFAVAVTMPSRWRTSSTASCSACSQRT